MDIHDSWKPFFNKQAENMYFSNLLVFIELSYSRIIYPPKNLVFNAFKLTALDDVKVVVLGQDPYHQKGQAMGLAFSVPQNQKLPPSLVNIFKEMQNDLGDGLRTNGDLTDLALQGVFLLNTVLTVEEGKPLSHQNSEYETFIGKVLEEISKRHQPMVYILWGNYAKKYRKYIKGTNFLILEANHPSPLSANRGGFFGCHHFSKTNEYLSKKGLNPIVWK